jgi:transcriptional regulator with XRE-family HTH domain
MSVTVQQFRAARGFLGWSQQELAARARVSRSVIAGFELGTSTPQPRVMEALVEAFEAAGIIFLQPAEGKHGLGVAFKWGADVPEGTPHIRPRAGGPASGLKSAWDGFGEDGGSPLDPQLASWWVDQSELWDRLSPRGRETLSLKIFSHPYAGEGFFRTGASKLREDGDLKDELSASCRGSIPPLGTATPFMGYHRKPTN